MGTEDQANQKGMARQKKKKEKGIKWFPGHDLYMTIVIVIAVGSVMIFKACL